MGLFRRGTKLLKLGSGLRDCCCRPENPEECFAISDWCRYHWRISDGTLIPDTELVSQPCPFADKPSAYFAPTVSAFGMFDDLPFFAGTAIRSQESSVRSIPSRPTAQFTCVARYAIEGYLSAAARSAFFPITGSSFPPSCFTGTYQTNARVFLYVENTEEFPNITYKAIASLNGNVSAFRACGPNAAEPQFGLVHQNQLETEPISLSPFLECNGSNAYSCSFVNSSVLHFTQDLVFEFSETGVTLNATLYPWVVGSSDMGAVPAAAQATGYLLEPTITLVGRSFCSSGPCDCTKSLTGMTVTFEGKTFTYGSLQQFVDGVDTWEETLPGLFRRTTRETCDGTYVAAVKIAEVFCETVDGTDYWSVYLDSECYERDEATCPASPDARRIMQWTGVFTCGEDGKPGGTPHSATDAAEPPDLDSNTTLGTPAAECAGDLDLPAISFG